jgi:hypothetical protein
LSTGHLFISRASPPLHLLDLAAPTGGAEIWHSNCQQRDAFKMTDFSEWPLSQ